MRRAVIIVLWCFLVTTSGLAAPLTRADAKGLIMKHGEFLSTESIAGIDDHAFSIAKDNGIWVDDRRGWWAVSVKGRKYFTSISSLGVRLVKPLHREVSAITGISEGPQPGTKLVEFTWHFTDLTRPISGFTGAKTDDHEGTAILREYDDGWRVVKVELGDAKIGTNSRPYALSEEDIKSGSNIFQVLPSIRIVARLTALSEVGLEVKDVRAGKDYTVVLAGQVSGISPAVGNDPFGKELLKPGDELNISGGIDGFLIYPLDVRLIEGEYREGTKWPKHGDPETKIAVVGKVQPTVVTLSFAYDSGWKEIDISSAKVLSGGTPVKLSPGDRVVAWINFWHGGKYTPDRGTASKIVLLRRDGS